MNGGFTPELNVAFLLDRYLLDCFELAFETRQFSGVLVITTNEKSGGPEDDNSDAGYDRIVRGLLVLHAREVPYASRYALYLERELGAIITAELERGNILASDLIGGRSAADKGSKSRSNWK